MNPSELESRLKSLPLRAPSEQFGERETLAEALDRSTPSLTVYQRIREMPWQLKSLGGFGIAASVLAAYLALTSTSGSIAFAQVVKQLSDAKTLTFNSEVQSVTDDKIKMRSRNYYMIPGMHRAEMTDGQNQTGYVVFNTKAGKVLMADSASKTVRVSALKGTGERDMALDMIKSIQSLKADEATPVAEKEIGGKPAKGMQFKRNEDTQTVWTDAATGELVQVEFYSENIPSGPFRTVWTNIQMNEPLDPELFSTQPPEGFKVMPSIDIDVSTTPAQHMSKLLALYAKYMDGAFPSTFPNDLYEIGKHMAPDIVVNQSSNEILELSMSTAAVIAFMRAGKQGELWEYYPGHRLGEKEAVVFWIADAKNPGKYEALYGDLRIESVPKDQLPAAQPEE